MQIVIDIPEKLYNRMKTYQGLDDTYIVVKHGTPLPKGHGRLIDADKLFPDVMKVDGSMAISQGQLAHAKTVEAIPKTDYENRLKADMVAILDKIRAEIDKIYEREGHSFDCLNALDDLKEFIDKCKAESEEG